MVVNQQNFDADIQAAGQIAQWQQPWQTRMYDCSFQYTVHRAPAEKYLQHFLLEQWKLFCIKYCSIADF
jgi:hypothetical protein